MPNTLNPATVRAFLLLSAGILSGGALAAPQFLPAQPGDLRAAQLAAPDTMQKSFGAPDLERAPVAMSWAVDGAIATAPQSFVAQSREYYTEVSADELAAGVTIHTTSPRALVRLQPLAAGSAPRESLAIHPASLVITSGAGRAYASGSGMEMLVTADKLNKAEIPFAEGTSAFRVHPELGAGALKLRAPELHGSARYMVNVVEPDSKFALTMQTGAPTYLHGQQLLVLPDLVEQGAGRLAPGKIDGFVTSPGGRSFPVRFKPDQDGRMRAALKLDADEAPAPGLWEVHANSEAMVRGQLVKRSLRLAFGVAMPVARLDGSAAMANQPGSMGVRLGVDVGAPGRYEVRALLYGMVGGAMKPLGVAHAANWLEPGRQQLVMRYGAELLAGASGPFELRDLNLIDQGRMGVLQRQQRALSIAERDVERGGAQLVVAPPAQRIKQ
jgi:hypothetical protein